MAEIAPWTDELRQQWDAWLAQRPKRVRRMARRFPPNRLYRMKSTGQRVTLLSYADDGESARVLVSSQYNFLSTVNREVFGVRFSDLEECDLPADGELVGNPHEDGVRKFNRVDPDASELIMPPLGSNPIADLFENRKPRRT